MLAQLMTNIDRGCKNNGSLRIRRRSTNGRAYETRLAVRPPVHACIALCDLDTDQMRDRQPEAARAYAKKVVDSRQVSIKSLREAGVIEEPGVLARPYR